MVGRNSTNRLAVMRDSSSLIHKFMGSRDVGRLVIGSGGTSSSSDLSADNYKGCSLMELAALSLLLIKVLGSVDLTLIVIIARCFRGSYIKIKIASQKRVALHTKLVVTHRHRFLPSLECCCHPVRNKVSLGRRGCRLSTQVLFLFEISELRNAIGIGGRRACDPPVAKKIGRGPMSSSSSLASLSLSCTAFISAMSSVMSRCVSSARSLHRFSLRHPHSSSS